MSGVVVLWALVFIVRMVAKSNAGGAAATRPPSQNAPPWRRRVRTALVNIWAISGVPQALFLLALSSSDVRDNARLLILPLAITSSWLVAGAALFFTWPILRLLAHLGRPKLVYRLAHAVLLFAPDTYAGAALLAGIALAHRGHVTRAECDWLLERIGKERRPLGAYAAALALQMALRARVLQDEGDVASAREAWEKARVLFGTLTYASPLGAPKEVVRFAHGFLALNEARAGVWAAISPDDVDDLGSAGRALRGWVDERLRQTPPSKKTERARRRAKSPILEALFARSDPGESRMSTREAHALASNTYVALSRGEPADIRDLLAMLNIFDTLMDPSFPETLVPPELKEDEQALAEVQDEVARAIAEPMARAFVPIYALNAYGPISARVYQRLEHALLGDLERACRLADERVTRKIRLEPQSEWLEASTLRATYRRVEIALGPEAAAHAWQVYVRAYCRLGVNLSEVSPRMRPLAHAVFKSLWQDAVRFNDQVNVEQQAHNMKVTSGVD